MLSGTVAVVILDKNAVRTELASRVEQVAVTGVSDAVCAAHWFAQLHQPLVLATAAD